MTFRSSFAAVTRTRRSTRCRAQAALLADRRSRALRTTRAPWRRARCSSRSKGSTPTAPRSRADAIARGAVAVFAEGAGPGRHRGVRGSRWRTRGSRSPRSPPEFYGRPSEQLTLVGITGTNGKTTTSYLLASIFEAAGIKCGRIGTVGYRIGDREFDAARTTPEAPELQRMLRDMVAQGCGACVMEVSSHALALRRADHLRFAAAIFTNLTRDHLDFHGDMEQYFSREAPALRDAAARRRSAITNADDPRGADFAAAVRRPVTYAIDAPADVRPGPLGLRSMAWRSMCGRRAGTLRIEVAARRPSERLQHPRRRRGRDGARPAVQRHRKRHQPAVQRARPLPGRVRPSDEVRVVVDYAHTDDALKNLLETARPLAAGRVITVFGCGGDRDKTKRPLMGAVAARLSDVVVVTSDNPRSEDPERIIDDIKRGIVLPAGPQGAEQGKAPERDAVCARDLLDRRRRSSARSARPARRSRADRRQGSREVPGHRRADASVRRRGSGSRGARAAPRIDGCRNSGAAGVAHRRGSLPQPTGGRVASGSAATPIGRVSIDTRTLAAGDFFVAIRGERFDGHAFVGDALAEGGGRRARRATRSVAAGAGDAVVVEAADTTKALQDVGRFVRRESARLASSRSPEARERRRRRKSRRSCLSARYRVFRNKGNLNNHIGLPLSLLELRSGPDVAVVELGMNHPGEIRTLVGIAEPEVRVWTNVGDAHIGFFASRGCHRRREGRGPRRRPRRRRARGQRRRSASMSRATSFRGRVVTFGIERDADVRATRVEMRGLEGTRGDGAHAAGEFRLRVAAARPRQSVERSRRDRGGASTSKCRSTRSPNAWPRCSPRITAASCCGCPAGVTLIDDSYNSSPAALKRSRSR